MEYEDIERIFTQDLDDKHLKNEILGIINHCRKNKYAISETINLVVNSSVFKYRNKLAYNSLRETMKKE